MSDWKDDYTIVDGIIRDPGKFEGQAAYALDVWDWFMNGDRGEEFYDGLGRPINVYTTTQFLKETLELRDDTHALELYVDDNGFVYVSELTEAEYAEFPEKESAYA